MIPAWLLTLLDLALALGAALRLTRFIVADDIPGGWWIKEPLHNVKHAWQRRHPVRMTYTDPKTRTEYVGEYQPEPPWARYLEGLSCPYCVSVWMAAVTTLSLLAAGGPGDAADWWRWIAGFLTLAWLTGHIAARAGDVEG